MQWITKGDAGQRALIAWGMGWEPAQKISGRDWLYPYLIYSLTDSYAAIRFDAWKSLQTLPGFNDFPFTYTANERVLNEAASDAYAKWLQRVRDLSPPFPSESALENDGRFRQTLSKSCGANVMRNQLSSPSRSAPLSVSMTAADRHIRFGWWSLFVFVCIGITLETLHGFKSSWYLDVGNEIRRLMFTLGHAHGAALSLINIAAGLTSRASDEWPIPSLNFLLPDLGDHSHSRRIFSRRVRHVWR